MRIDPLFSTFLSFFHSSPNFHIASGVFLSCFYKVDAALLDPPYQLISSILSFPPFNTPHKSSGSMTLLSFSMPTSNFGHPGSFLGPSITASDHAHFLFVIFWFHPHLFPLTHTLSFTNPQVGLPRAWCTTPFQPSYCTVSFGSSSSHSLLFQTAMTNLAPSLHPRFRSSPPPIYVLSPLMNQEEQLEGKTRICWYSLRVRNSPSSPAFRVRKSPRGISQDAWS